jgi:hypothetical protein
MHMTWTHRPRAQKQKHSSRSKAGCCNDTGLVEKLGETQEATVFMNNRYVAYIASLVMHHVYAVGLNSQAMRHTYINKLQK